MENFDSRRNKWLIQQEREREHERLKQQKILDYELKRAALLNKTNNIFPRSQSASKDNDGSKSITNPRVMSEMYKTSRESIFRGPSTSSKPTEAELRQIKVDIRRNIPGAIATNVKLQREIINPEDVIVKRRDDEGIRPIFDAIELKTPDDSRFSDEEECEEIKTISFKKSERYRRNGRSERSNDRSRPSSSHHHDRSNYSPRRRSSRERSGSGDRRRGELSRSRRRERSVHNQRRRSQRRSKSSDRRNGRSERSNDRSRPSSSRHHDRSSYSPLRASSRKRSGSRDRGRDELSRSRRDDRGRSRERRDNYRQSERENSERKSREMTTDSHIEDITVPVYYGDFPRPMMMGPMMPPMRGPPPVRNRPPFGPRFAPRFPPRFPPRPRFNRQF